MDNRAKCYSPPGTFDTEKIPPAGLSSVEPVVSVEPATAEVELEDASAVLWRDKSTCTRVSIGPVSNDIVHLHEIAQ